MGSVRKRLCLAAAVLASATVGAVPAAASVPAASGSAAAAGSAPAPALADPHPCAGQPGITCSTLTVPLDHSGRTPGTLRLQVATADNANAPKGTLLFLTGGPGQPGVPLISRLATQRLPEVARNYRFVMLDQRGSGELGAIDCPLLQRQVGGGDVEAPTPEAIAECAEIIGPHRQFYGIDDNVADFEALRRALGVQKMTVDGVSYGTFTAARYAVAHPHRVRKLVLDSVVPHVDPDRDSAMYLAGLRASARVLREVCAVPPRCDFDPAADLARVVRAGRHDATTAATTDGTTLFDRLVTYGFIDRTYRDPAALTLPNGRQVGDIVGAIHAAGRGDGARLDELVALLDGGGEPAAQHSAGLHVATACTDMRFPWGDSATPLAARQPALDRRIAGLRRAEVWPFDRESARGIGFIQKCLRWPPTAPSPEPSAGSMLPRVPTLLISGERDLSTPIEWTFDEARRAPMGEVVIVEDAYHSIQNREQGTEGRRAVTDFLNR
jgi:pimeloyl-ACP methyl ester carboxylesterase